MKISAYESGLNALCLLDLPSVRSPKIAAKLKNSKNVNISCVDDKNLHAKPYKCEIGAISFVLALLAKMSAQSEFTALDEGYLSAESCLGEEEAAEILGFLKEAEFIIFDENLKKHKDFENIAYFLGFLCEKFSLNLACSDEKGGEIFGKFSDLKELENYDGLVICDSNDENLRCSRQFLQIAKIKDGDLIEINFAKFTLKTQIKMDENLQGTIGFLNLSKCGFTGFGFVKAQIKKAQNE